MSKAQQLVDCLLEARDARAMREKLAKALMWLRQRNPTGYAQATMSPGWPWPAYVEDDPNDPWWTSEEAVARLQELKDAAHEGVKPETDRPRLSPSTRHWPPLGGNFPKPGDMDYGEEY